MNSEDRPPKWAYLISVLLVVMSSLLAVTIVFVVFVLLGILPRETDIQMPLLLITLPLSMLIPLTALAMAVLLTKKRE
ncbi:MAG: hypothetical protein ACXADS_03725 [Candidatus Thorarchaeota archaeon]